MSTFETKREWRAEFLRRRSDMPPSARTSILTHALPWILRQRPVCVHAYLAKRDAHELDLTELMSTLTASGIDVVVPRITDVVNGSMELVEWTPTAILRPNRFGIDEPVSGRVRDAMDVDLWIVPLLGADRSGNRLGFGAGFYDRMLRNTAGVKVGMLPESCLTDILPTETHDVPLDVIITESGVFNAYL